MDNIVNNIWRYRELLFFLTWREIKVRYKQTFLGIIWAILTPLIQALVFALVFGVFLKTPTGRAPYLPVLFAGFTFWNFLSQSISTALPSFTGNVNLVTKSVFPKEILVLATVLSRLPDILAAFLVLIIILLIYQIYPTFFALWLLFFFLTEVILAYGLGLLFSSVNVYFRDITAIVPLLLMVWLFLTPVVYPLSSIPYQYRFLVKLNPMTDILEGIRKALIFGTAPDLSEVLMSLVVSILILVVSYVVFNRLKSNFADII